MFSVNKHILFCFGILLILEIILIGQSKEINNKSTENEIDMNNIILSDKNVNTDYSSVKNNITDYNITDDSNFVFQSTTFRLPNNTVPLLYNLHFNFGNDYINNTETNFTGHTNIKILIKESTRYIVLNAKNLTSFKVHVTHLNSTTYDNYSNIANIEYEVNNEKNFLIIFVKNFDYEFKKNNYYIIDIKYKGLLQNNKAKGLYMCNDYELEMPVIATQFEPTYARGAFPCFDEPFFKARFVLQLTYSSIYRALSNAQIEFDYITEGLNNESSPTRTTGFMESPLMSTYTLAFIIHPNYSHISTEQNNITYSLYYNNPAPNPKDMEVLEHTVNEISRIILKLEDIFEIPYPLPKLDIIGVPKTTGIAVENWGLVMINQYDSFLNITCNDFSNHIRTIIFTHELVHQWFGNLVTSYWWSTIWLNEGFATYYGNILAMQFFPECGISEQYAHLEMRLLKIQMSNKSPISKYVETEDDIFNRFDMTTYNQAGQIIAMWENCLTRDVFISGLRNYLRNMQYLTATEDDLFLQLEEIALESNITIFKDNSIVIKDFFKTWTHNLDVPQISVFRNYEQNEIILKQSSMIKNNSDLWPIPLNFATATQFNFNDTRFTFIMNATNDYLNINTEKDLNITLNKTDWLFVNKRGIGAYSVKYDKTNWLLLAKALQQNHEVFDVTSRIFILIDVLTFLDRADLDENFDLEVVFEVLSYLKFEKSVAVWYHIYAWLHNSYSHLKKAQITNNMLETFFIKQSEWTFEQFASINISSVNNNIMIGNMKKDLRDLFCSLKLNKALRQSYEQMQEFIKIYFNPDIEEEERAELILRELCSCGGILLANKTFKYEILKVAQEIPSPIPFFEFAFSFYCTDDVEFANEIIRITLNHMTSINTTDYEKNLMYDFLMMFLTSEASVSWNLVVDNIEKHFVELIKNEKRFEKLLKLITEIYFSADYESKIDNIIQRFKEKSTLGAEFVWNRTESPVSKYRKYGKQATDWLTKYFQNNESI